MPKGTAQNGDRWIAASFGETIRLVTCDSGGRVVQYYTPEQARQIADAMAKLADDAKGGA